MNNLNTDVVKKFSLLNPTKKCGMRKQLNKTNYKPINQTIDVNRPNINIMPNRHNLHKLPVPIMSVKSDNNDSNDSNDSNDRDIRSIIKGIIREPLRLRNENTKLLSEPNKITVKNQIENPILSYKNRMNRMNRIKKTKINSDGDRKIVVPNNPGSEVHIHIHTDKKQCKPCQKCKSKGKSKGKPKRKKTKRKQNKRGKKN